MDILAKINQLEQQILVHSIIYYRLGMSIWNDAKWNEKAKELQHLTEQHPEKFKESILFEEFKGFSWVSGYDLPLYDPRYTAKALWLIDYYKQQGGLVE